MQAYVVAVLVYKSAHAIYHMQVFINFRSNVVLHGAED